MEINLYTVEKQLILKRLFEKFSELSTAVENMNRDDPRHAGVYLKYMMIELELKDLVIELGELR